MGIILEKGREPHEVATVILDPSTLAIALEDYRERGWVPVPLEGKLPDINGKGWHQRDYEDSDFAGRNLGIILNRSNLADVDLDCREAQKINHLFLPPTKASFGRASVGRRHVLYRPSEMLPTAKLRDPLFEGPDGEKAVLVEYRSGSGQTMFPPSIHPDTGETVTWLEGKKNQPP